MSEVVFVEIPSGSRNKYEWDGELGAIVLDRRLFTSMSYPADYGYIEGAMGAGHSQTPQLGSAFWSSQRSGRGRLLAVFTGKE